MQAVIEEINDKHLGPWAELIQHDGTENTPLTPYMDEELLYYKFLYLSNDKLKDTGYKLKVPFLTREKIEEVITDFIEHGLLPRSLRHNWTQQNRVQLYFDFDFIWVFAF